MLIWCSDIHLNFLEKQHRLDFYKELKQAEEHKILITGDIAESHNLGTILSEMKAHTGKKIYFVAGNHDYYGSSINKMKKQMSTYKCATYLPKRFGYKLSSTAWLTGADGWGDCRNGDVERSNLRMADWVYVDELRENSKMGQTPPIETLQKYADADAERMCKNVIKCIERGAKKVIMASHVPPFEEACLYAGKKSTPDGLPFFSSQIFGVSILPIVEAHPDVEFIWLSGHTHSGCTVRKRKNFTVKVAEAQYYVPRIEEII